MLIRGGGGGALIKMSQHLQQVRTCLENNTTRDNRSAYHLNGIFGNSRENSNGTVHPGGMFSEKR